METVDLCLDTSSVSNGCVWIDPHYTPRLPESHYFYPTPWLGFQWYPAPKQITEFSDAELVAELKRRKKDRNPLDQIEIKED